MKKWVYCVTLHLSKLEEVDVKLLVAHNPGAEIARMF